MRLTSVSIGKTRTLHIKGQPVTTAYLKEPVEGAVRITQAGVEGNEVAVHTDAVYAYSEAGYEYWAAELGVDRAQWSSGFFGENLTIDGLNEATLCIGDRVRIGEAVELIVAGPRIPCFKLSWRMGQPDTFIARFANSGRTGVYFAVTREGTVRAGDAVTVLERSSFDTVAETAAFMFGDAPVTTQRLEQLLALPYISQTAALFLRNRLYRILDYEQTLPDRWQGWRALRIVRVVDECTDIRSFYLQPLDGGRLPRYRAGQFLTIRLPIEGGEVQRTWSLSDYDGNGSTYRISVKKQPQGVASAWMHEHAVVGMQLEARAPAGRFVLDRGSFKPVMLIAAGVGITPLLAMAKSHRARAGYRTPLYIIYCARSGEHVAFRDELAELATESDITVAYVYSQPRAGETQGTDYAHGGRLDLRKFAELVGDAHIIHGGRRVELPWYDCDVYFCGPQQFQDQLLAEVRALGVDPERIRRESFVSASAAAWSDEARSADIVLQRSSRTLRWQADGGLSLLELIEREGVQTDSGCRMGACHACKCRLISGEVEHSFTPHGLESGAVLLCCARPASERITLDL